MTKKYEVSFVQSLKNDSQSISERKEWINSVILNKQHSYIYSREVVLGESNKLTEDGDLIIDITDHPEIYTDGLMYTRRLIITAKSNSVIRMNVFNNDYDEFKVEYIPAIVLYDILKSEKNSEEYQVDCISEPVYSSDGFTVNANIAAVNIIAKDKNKHISEDDKYTGFIVSIK